MSDNMDWENGRLGRALRQLPVPPPSAGFEGRVLGALRRPRFHAALLRPALAAAVTLAVGLAAGLSLPRDSGRAAAPAASIDLATAEVKPVRLLFRSPRALSGVTVQLRLPEGVELQGHPGRQLSWRTDLQAGANLLELPVIVHSGEGGMLTAELSLGQDRKQFAVMVKARRPAVLYLERPAARMAAGRSVFFV